MAVWKTITETKISVLPTRRKKTMLTFQKFCGRLEDQWHIATFMAKKKKKKKKKKNHFANKKKEDSADISHVSIVDWRHGT